MSPSKKVSYYGHFLRAGMEALLDAHASIDEQVEQLLAEFRALGRVNSDEPQSVQLAGEIAGLVGVRLVVREAGMVPPHWCLSTPSPHDSRSVVTLVDERTWHGAPVVAAVLRSLIPPSAIALAFELYREEVPVLWRSYVDTKVGVLWIMLMEYGDMLYRVSAYMAPPSPLSQRSADDMVIDGESPSTSTSTGTAHYLLEAILDCRNMRGDRMTLVKMSGVDGCREVYMRLRALMQSFVEVDDPLEYDPNGTDDVAYYRGGADLPLAPGTAAAYAELDDMNLIDE